jgi:hypothetical protein
MDEHFFLLSQSRLQRQDLSLLPIQRPLLFADYQFQLLGLRRTARGLSYRPGTTNRRS